MTELKQVEAYMSMESLKNLANNTGRVEVASTQPYFEENYNAAIRSHPNNQCVRVLISIADPTVMMQLWETLSPEERGFFDRNGVKPTIGSMRQLVEYYQGNIDRLQSVNSKLSKLIEDMK